MHHSLLRIGHIVIAGLGLAYGLSSSNAEAHPSGASVSVGSNPVRSVAGDFNLGSSTSVVSSSSVMSSPDDQDLVLTDVMVGLTNWASDGCQAGGKVQLMDAEGTIYGSFVVAITHLNNGPWHPTIYTSTSGIRIPAGKTLHMQWDWHYRACGETYYELVYTMSGYLAKP